LCNGNAAGAIVSAVREGKVVAKGTNRYLKKLKKG